MRLTYKMLMPWLGRQTVRKFSLSFACRDTASMLEHHAGLYPIGHDLPPARLRLMASFLVALGMAYIGVGQTDWNRELARGRAVWAAMVNTAGENERAGLKIGEWSLADRRLSDDELAVVFWLRAQKNHDWEFERHQVPLLMVGVGETVAIADHQLDHIGGGMTSVVHGVELVAAIPPDVFVDGEPARPELAIYVNRLSLAEIL